MKGPAIPTRRRTAPIILLALLSIVSLACYAIAQSSASSWKQAALIKASNKEDGDQFGSALALSRDGSTLAVGAPMESSSATGINGRQADESAYSSGAVYVFTRTANGWPRICVTARPGHKC